MSKPEVKEHLITCATNFSMKEGRRCDCGAREWNLACSQWEEYIEDNYSRKIRPKRRD